MNGEQAADVLELLRHIDGSEHQSPRDLVAVCDRLAYEAARALRQAPHLDTGVLRTAFDVLEAEGWETAEHLAPLSAYEAAAERQMGEQSDRAQGWTS